MSDPSIQPITATLVEIVSAAPGQRVLGARLGASLKAAHPDFNPLLFKARSLRDFIRTHVPELVEKGRSGPDLLYGLASTSSPHQSSFSVPTLGALYVPAPTSPLNWRAFTNPSYPYLLAANTETGELKVSALGIETLPPWVALPKPTSEDHLEIARSFLSTLEDQPKEVLEPLLRDPKWFVSFSAATKRLGLSSVWGSFRTAQLRNRFEEALRELRVPQRGLRPSEPTSFRVHDAYSLREPKGGSSEARLRDLVAHIVSEMPIEEVRELRLPVGPVFDFLLNH